MIEYKKEDNPYPDCDKCSFWRSDSCNLDSDCPNIAWEDGYKQALKDTKSEIERLHKLMADIVDMPQKQDLREYNRGYKDGRRDALGVTK
jgi:hypothetical protein